MKIACNNISLESINADGSKCRACALYRKWDICMNVFYSKNCYSRYVYKSNLDEIFKI